MSPFSFFLRIAAISSVDGRAMRARGEITFANDLTLPSPKMPTFRNEFNSGFATIPIHGEYGGLIHYGWRRRSETELRRQKCVNVK